MATHISGINLSFCINVFIVFIFLFGKKFHVEAKRSYEQKISTKSKGTVRTLKDENGDTIDCVDIYKQPAFDHPLLRNHTIQHVKCTNTNFFSTENNVHPNISQTWNKKEHCPDGTIPIRRTNQGYKESLSSIKRHKLFANDDVHEYVTVSTVRASYYGAHARLNVWNPNPEASTEFSLAQIWVVSDLGDDSFESIEVGWMVNPVLYGDYQTRFFVYWTSDDYQTTGCYNLQCPGFVQTNPSIVMGGTLTPTSTYGGLQTELTLDIYKDVCTGNWFVLLNQVILGYWPSALFTNLAVSANIVDWGGEIADDNTERHTTTPMGSGHFASDGYQKASYISELRVQDAPLNWIVPSPLRPKVRTPGCYSLEFVGDETFYYGGPGYSATSCP